MFNAAANGDIPRVAFLLEVDVEQIMLDAADNRGDTPLHAACCNGRPEAVELLLSYAARPNIKNRANYTPHDLAKLCNKPRCLEIMTEYLGFYNPVPAKTKKKKKKKNKDQWDMGTVAAVASHVQVRILPFLRV